jgi:pyridoxine 4-dehydrogenase
VHRDDDPLVDALTHEGIAFVPFFPLGGFTPIQSAALGTVARRLETTPMQVARAWLLARSPNILLIPGTSSVAHLEENLQAGARVLGPLELEELDRIGGTGEPRRRPLNPHDLVRRVEVVELQLFTPRRRAYAAVAD